MLEVRMMITFGEGEENSDEGNRRASRRLVMLVSLDGGYMDVFTL